MLIGMQTNRERGPKYISSREITTARTYNFAQQFEMILTNKVSSSNGDGNFA